MGSPIKLRILIWHADMSHSVKQSYIYAYEVNVSKLKSQKAEWVESPNVGYPQEIGFKCLGDLTGMS